MIHRTRSARIAITWTVLLAFVLSGTIGWGYFLCLGEDSHVGLKAALDVSCEPSPPYTDQTGVGSRSGSRIISTGDHCGPCVDVHFGQPFFNKTKTSVKRVPVIVRAGNPGADHYEEKPAQGISLPSLQLTANSTLSFLQTIVMLI